MNKVLNKILKLSKQNLILTGLRGSGKTTFGKHLSQQFHIPFLDLDHLIEQQNNSTITSIVSKYGWPHFRELEHQTLKNLQPTTQTIIALGGGTIIQPNNQQIIKNLGNTIYLHITPEQAYQRIKKQNNRPLLSAKTLLSDLQKNYQDRHKIYQTQADYTFESLSLPKPPNTVKISSL